jgi:hypothetical protein
VTFCFSYLACAAVSNLLVLILIGLTKFVPSLETTLDKTEQVAILLYKWVWPMFIMALALLAIRRGE